MHHLLHTIFKRVLSMGNSCTAFIRAANIVLCLLSAAIIFFVMVLVTADVTGRYALDAPISGTYEMGESFMVAIVFFAMGYTQMVKGNVQVDTIVRHFSQRKQYLVEVLGSFMGAVFFAVVMYWSWFEAWDALIKGRETAGVLAFPLFPIKLFVTIGAASVFLQFLIDLVQNVKYASRPGVEL